jgi:hypothetical protein
MLSVKLRNTSFTKCRFVNLEFIKHPAPIHNEEEGRITQDGEFRFPLMTWDPNNAYNSICVGHSKPISSKISYYDKDLHETFKSYHENQEYNEVDVYKSFWSGHEIYCVDFLNSTVESTNMEQIHFKFGLSVNTIFSNMKFKNLNFEEMKIKNSIFKNCVFDTCQFDNAEFIKTQFINCEFDNHGFRNINNLDVEFIDSKFNRSYFQICRIPLNIFKRCKANNVDVICCGDINNKWLSENKLQDNINRS